MWQQGVQESKSGSSGFSTKDPHVLVLKQDGGLERSFGNSEKGKAKDKLNQPMDIAALGYSSDVVVADSGNNRLVIYGDSYKASISEKSPNLFKPIGVVCRDMDICVVDANNKRVLWWGGLVLVTTQIGNIAPNFPF